MASTISDHLDKPLKTADKDDDITVLEYVKQLEEEGKKQAERYIIKSERNESFVRGEQFTDINPSGWTMEDVEWGTGVPQIYNNYLRNPVLTITSRITKDRRTAYAYPNTSQPRDKAAAEAANQLIEHMEHEYDMPDLLFEVVLYCLMHGVSGIKPFYDPEYDVIRLDLATIYDFYIDRAQRIEDCRWVIFRRFIDKHEAKAAFKSVGKKDVELSTEEYYMEGDDQGERVEGVPLLELWHVPTARFPEGITATVIGGNVLEYFPFEYTFEALENPESGVDRSFLPIALMQAFPIRNSQYGDTPVNDAIPIQRQINEVESTLSKIRRDTAMAILIASKSVSDAIKDGNRVVVETDHATAQITGYVDPPRINTILFEDREKLVQKLYDVLGVNEILSGQESPKAGTSAKHLAYQAELDGAKHSGIARSFEKMLLRLWEIVLNLAQTYYDEARLIRIMGPDNQIYSVPFKGSDIRGVNVVLETGSGFERMRAQVGQNMVNETQLGVQHDPNVVKEALATGLRQTDKQALDVRIAREMISSVMSGQEARPEQELDPQVAIKEISMAIGITDDPMIQQRLEQLKQHYTMQMRQAQMQQPLQQGMPTPNPAGPGGQQR